MIEAYLGLMLVHHARCQQGVRRKQNPHEGAHMNNVLALQQKMILLKQHRHTASRSFASQAAQFHQSHFLTP